MKRSITIPKEEYLFFDNLIKDEQKLDDYGHGEVIEKFYAYFEDNIECMIEIINDYRPHVRATLGQDRKILKKQNYFFNLPEKIFFNIDGLNFEVSILSY